MNVSGVTGAVGWILVRPGVVCGVVKDKVRFHCHLCLKDMTELSREEKHQHLHSYHRDETVVRQKHGVSEDFPDDVKMKNVQEWNPSLQTKDHLTENCMDPGSLPGDENRLEVEEGVREKSLTNDDWIEKLASARFLRNGSHFFPLL